MHSLDGNAYLCTMTICTTPEELRVYFAERTQALAAMDTPKVHYDSNDVNRPKAVPKKRIKKPTNQILMAL